MTRSAVVLVCCVILNGISGCACCSCGPQPSGCCPSYGGGEFYGADYPVDMGYGDVGYGDMGQGGGDCGCDGGMAAGAGFSQNALNRYQQYAMPAGTQQFRNNSYAAQSAAMAPQYANHNPAPKLIHQHQHAPQRRMTNSNSNRGQLRQASLSDWDLTPAGGGNIVPQSYQQPAPCNCGR